MKKFKGYSEAKVISQQDRLPVGGYVLEIKNAEVKEYDTCSVLVFSFDISEGDYKGFYAENYRNQSGEDKKWKGNFRLYIPTEDGSEKDEHTIRRFKTAIVDIEESNPGYNWDWDESKLKGKKIGGVFRNKEYSYKGSKGFFTECAWFTSVQNIKDGKFTIPADKLLNVNVTSSVNPNSPDIMPELSDDDLPF